MIQTSIAYNTDGNLGKAYNEIMQRGADWVLFLDHDIFLCNPHWHYICSQVIKQYPDTGLFTCWTNRIARGNQKSKSCPKTDNLQEHRQFAKKLFLASQFNCTTLSDHRVSGMFFLIKRASWELVGGFPAKGLFGEDWEFAKRLYDNKIPLRRIDGLYVYHLRDRTEGSWIKGQRTSKEIGEIVNG